MSRSPADRRITHARIEKNTSGSLLAHLTLTCGHGTTRPVKGSQVKDGAVHLGTNHLPCGQCLRQMKAPRQYIPTIRFRKKK